MKFCHLIIKKIIKFVATRCQIFRLKCTQFHFSWGSAPYRAAYGAPPDLLTGLKRPTSKTGDGKEGRGGRKREMMGLEGGERT